MMVARAAGVSSRPAATPRSAIRSTIRWLISVPFTVAATGPLEGTLAAGFASLAGLHAATAKSNAAPPKRVADLMMLSPVGGWGGAHAPAYSMMPSSPSGPLDGPLILNRREYSGQGKGACFSKCREATIADEREGVPSLAAECRS